MVNQTCRISFTRQLRSRPCGHGSARWFVPPHETMHHPSCARRSTCSLHWKVRKPGNFKCKFHHFEVCPPGKTAKNKKLLPSLSVANHMQHKVRKRKNKCMETMEIHCRRLFSLDLFCPDVQNPSCRHESCMTVWLYQTSARKQKKQRCYKSANLRNNSDQDWGNHDCRDKIMIRKRRMHKKKHEDTHFKTAKQELKGKARAKRADNSTNIRITHNSTAKSTRKELCFFSAFLARIALTSNIFPVDMTLLHAITHSISVGSVVQFRFKKETFSLLSLTISYISVHYQFVTQSQGQKTSVLEALTKFPIVPTKADRVRVTFSRGFQRCPHGAASRSRLQGL